MQKNQFVKVKYSILKSEKKFIEFNNRELNDREVKIKREIEELFLNHLSCLQMNKLSLNKEKQKIRSIKNTCYD